MQEAKILKGILDAVVKKYQVNEQEVKDSERASHSVLMARGCFVGLANSIGIPKKRASEFISSSRQKGAFALDYYRRNKKSSKAENDKLVLEILQNLSE